MTTNDSNERELIIRAEMKELFLHAHRYNEMTDLLNQELSSYDLAIANEGYQYAPFIIMTDTDGGYEKFDTFSDAFRFALNEYKKRVIQDMANHTSK